MRSNPYDQIEKVFHLPSVDGFNFSLLSCFGFIEGIQALKGFTKKGRFFGIRGSSRCKFGFGRTEIFHQFSHIPPVGTSNVLKSQAVSVLIYA